MLADAYFQKFFGVNITGNMPVTATKIHGLFGKKEILGTYLLRITPILFFICLLQKKNINFFLIFFYIIIEPMIFYSGQRYRRAQFQGQTRYADRNLRTESSS